MTCTGNTLCMCILVLIQSFRYSAILLFRVFLVSPNNIRKQGRRKQFPDGQAQLDVGGEVVDNSHAKHAAKICTSVFLAVRRRSHCTSASNWDSKAWKFSHTERKSYACTLRYVPCRILLQQFETTHCKCRTHNYVSTSAENGPAMAGPAGPVPVPMVNAAYLQHSHDKSANKLCSSHDSAPPCVN